MKNSVGLPRNDKTTAAAVRPNGNDIIRTKLIRLSFHPIN